jgi:hypothetical protein
VTGPLLPPGRPAPFVPPEGRVDRRQLGALLRLLTAQMIRRGTDGSSGMSGNPLVQTLFSMSFLGLLAAGGAFRPVDLDTFLARIFASALVIVALMITAEADDVRIRRAEILLAKPISGATHLASVAALLFLTAAIIAASYALLPLLAATWRLGLSPLLVVPLLLMLVLGAFGLVLVWVLVLRAGVQRFGADRIRMATQVSIVALIGLVTWSTLAAVTQASGPPALSSAVLDALPSTWLARFWTDDWSAAANLRRAAVMGLIAVGALVFVRFGQRASADSVFETSSRGRLTRAPLLARLLTRIGLVPGLRILLPAPAAALSGCIVTLGGREEASRLRGFVTLLLALGFATWGFWSDAGLMPVAILASVVVSVTLEGLAVARQSASAPAAWALAKSPMRSRHLVRAVQWAVLARFVLIPLGLFAALLFRRHTFGLAVVLTLAALLTARLIVAAALAFRPSFPLDEPPVVTGPLGQVVAWGAGTAGAVAYVVAATIAEMLGMLGTALVVVGTIGIGVLSIVAQAVAAQRCGRLEHAG